MYMAGRRVLILVHRAKTEACMYTAWTSTAVAVSRLVHFGSLGIHLDTTRQIMLHVKAGSVDIWCPADDGIARALAEWIVCDRVALITGWLGKGNDEMVTKLARSSGASWSVPMCQEVVLHKSAAVADGASLAQPQLLHHLRHLPGHTIASPAHGCTKLVSAGHGPLGMHGAFAPHARMTL